MSMVVERMELVRELVGVICIECCDLLLLICHFGYYWVAVNFVYVQ